MSTRREFLQKSLLAMGGLVIGGKGIAGTLDFLSDSETLAAPPAKELGLQIYSLQRELYDDLPRRMRDLREMGYVNLELAGYSQGKIGGVDMMEFKKMAEDAGLKIVSSHVNPEVTSQSVVSGQESGLPFYTVTMLPQIREFWKATAENHAKLGCKYLVQPMMPETASYGDALFLAELLNEGGRICKEAGITFGYHHHHFEFLRRFEKPGTPPRQLGIFEFKGEQVIDILLANTDPSCVMFELDTYWTIRGGNDPVTYLKNHADRIKLMHIKDTAVLGESGLLNFENIFKQIYANGIEYFFVEIEGMPGGRSQTDGVRGCAAYLQSMPFVK
jgi:sugar phosphate isomerase/epimerase